MLKIAYASSAVLYGIAGINSFQSMKDQQTAALLEESLNHEDPVTEGSTAYVALKCFGTLNSQGYFPTKSKVLVGRYSVVRLKLFSDEGIGITINENQDIVLNPPQRNKFKKYFICLPWELSLNSNGQQVIVHHLDRAQWQGSKKSVWKATDWREVAIALSTIHARVDESSSYHVISEWFEENSITIFGQATKIENRLYVKQPLNGYPFIATTMDPEAYIDLIKRRYLTLHEESIREFLLATLLTSSARAYQIKNTLPSHFQNIHWYHLRQYPQLKKIYTCFTFGALAGSVLLSRINDTNICPLSSHSLNKAIRS